MAHLGCKLANHTFDHKYNEILNFFPHIAPRNGHPEITRETLWHHHIQLEEQKSIPPSYSVVFLCSPMRNSYAVARSQ